MKTVFSILVAGILLSSTFALADSNGVERGDININTNAQIPAGVEDKIETTIFANCDLRGAQRISTGYLQFNRDEDTATNVYQIQYLVEFPAEGRQVTINVEALLHLQGEPGAAVEIKQFKSAICRSFP
jgi:hypothetical protein